MLREGGEGESKSGRREVRAEEERQKESDSQLALLSLPECCSIYSSHCTQGLSLMLLYTYTLMYAHVLLQALIRRLLHWDVLSGFVLP